MNQADSIHTRMEKGAGLQLAEIRIVYAAGCRDMGEHMNT